MRGVVHIHSAWSIIRGNLEVKMLIHPFSSPANWWDSVLRSIRCTLYMLRVHLVVLYSECQHAPSSVSRPATPPTPTFKALRPSALAGDPEGVQPCTTYVLRTFVPG